MANLTKSQTTVAEAKSNATKIVSGISFEIRDAVRKDTGEIKPALFIDGINAYARVKPITATGSDKPVEYRVSKWAVAKDAKGNNILKDGKLTFKRNFLSVKAVRIGINKVRLGNKDYVTTPSVTRTGEKMETFETEGIKFFIFENKKNPSSSIVSCKFKNIIVPA